LKKDGTLLQMVGGRLLFLTLHAHTLDVHKYFITTITYLLWGFVVNIVQLSQETKGRGLIDTTHDKLLNSSISYALLWKYYSFESY